MWRRSLWTPGAGICRTSSTNPNDGAPHARRHPERREARRISVEKKRVLRPLGRAVATAALVRRRPQNDRARECRLQHVDRFDGKIALITGASRGIGEAIARRLGVEGATVVAAARTVEALEKVVAGIAGAGGKAQALTLDLADPASVENGMKSILAGHGRRHSRQQRGC